MTDAADAVARGPDADASAVASSESLFDAMIVARAKGLAREVSRLVYVAPTGPSAAGGAAGGETPGRGAAAAAADSLHARLVQQQVASDGQGSVTGVLLALPGCVAHLLEGRSEALQRILGGLRAQRVGGPAGGGAASGPAADEAPEADACVRVGGVVGRLRRRLRVLGAGMQCPPCVRRGSVASVLRKQCMGHLQPMRCQGSIDGRS